jgi:pyruvate/2-oxoglutarate dehydrogenase complex dihydrolipoamide acyltransferase (E2) component
MARFEFKLPDIGEGVTEGEIVAWHVKEGDRVAEDQIMVEVMTDKATVTIGAPKAGKIDKLMHAVGTLVKVGDVLIVIQTGNGSKTQAGLPAATAATFAIHCPARATSARSARSPSRRTRRSTQ